MYCYCTYTIGRYIYRKEVHNLDDARAIQEVNLQLASEIAQNAETVKEAKSAKRKIDQASRETAQG